MNKSIVNTIVIIMSLGFMVLCYFAGFDKGFDKAVKTANPISNQEIEWEGEVYSYNADLPLTELYRIVYRDTVDSIIAEKGCPSNMTVDQYKTWIKQANGLSNLNNIKAGRDLLLIAVK